MDIFNGASIPNDPSTNGSSNNGSSNNGSRSSSLSISSLDSSNAGNAHFKEIEFELSPQQHELLGAVALQQGHPLELTFETTILLSELSSESWFTVQPEPLAPQFVKISPGTYAFSGQIQEAEIVKDSVNGEDEEIAFLLVTCGNVPLRVICGPGDDGRLPWGTWETRYLTGVSRIQGILEDDFATGIGMTIGATIWSVDRLVLSPGDPNFGEWYESDELPPSPYSHDKIFITARLHRQGI